MVVNEDHYINKTIVANFGDARLVHQEPVRRRSGARRAAKPGCPDNEGGPMKPIRTLNMNSNAVLVGLTLLLAGACTTPDSAWTLGGRTLPAPAAASDVLRESIANTPQPNVAEHIRTTTFTTKKEWVQTIRALDASNMQRGEALAERRWVTIKKAEIAGVTVRTVTPADIDPANENRLFVHVHGGA